MDDEKGESYNAIEASLSIYKQTKIDFLWTSEKATVVYKILCLY